jgi:hypothetical protein
MQEKKIYKNFPNVSDQGKFFNIYKVCFRLMKSVARFRTSGHPLSLYNKYPNLKY